MSANAVGLRRYLVAATVERSRADRIAWSAVLKEIRCKNSEEVTAQLMSPVEARAVVMGTPTLMAPAINFAIIDLAWGAGDRLDPF